MDKSLEIIPKKDSILLQEKINQVKKNLQQQKIRCNKMRLIDCNFDGIEDAQFICENAPQKEIMIISQGDSFVQARLPIGGGWTFYPQEQSVYGRSYTTLSDLLVGVWEGDSLVIVRKIERHHTRQGQILEEYQLIEGEMRLTKRFENAGFRGSNELMKLKTW